MRVALGISQNEPLAAQDAYAREAERLGYEAIWTNEGGVRDAFVTCARWATVAPGLGAGIAVAPVLLRTPMALAMAAGTLSEITEGRFTLGLGPASVAEYHRQYGTPEHPPLALMRDYVRAVRALLSGEPVEYEGKTLFVRGAQLEISPRPPRVPILLGVTSPGTLRLTGEVADGAVLNWCTPEQTAEYKDWMAEGARKAGRDAAELTTAAYVRICIDEDVAVARRALLRAAKPYMLGLPGYGAPYRYHFVRMGFADAVARAEAGHDVPDDVLRRFAYFGRAEGASEAVRELSRGLDLAIVRVVPARPGGESVLEGIRAGML